MSDVSKSEPSAPDTVAAARTGRPFDLPIWTRASSKLNGSRDHGVSLLADSLAWTIEGKGDDMPLARISRIQLQIGNSRNGGYVPYCTITFDDGWLLKIYGGRKTNMADAGQASLYREFVAALHHALSEADRRRIDFSYGLSPSGFAMLQVVLGIWASVFVALPAILLLKNIRALPILGFGAGVSWLLIRARNANIPGTYNCDTLPAKMFI